MADASLKIDIDLSGERHFGEVRRESAKTAASMAGLNSRLASVAKTQSKLESAAKSSGVKWKRYFGELDKIIASTGKLIQKGLTTSVKLFTAEIGLMSIAIVGMHGVLALGPRLMKAWTGTLNVAAAAAAAFGAAMAVAAAAVREQQVAMFAFKGSSSDMKNIKNNMGAVRATMRGMQTDSMLASTGMQNLSAAFAEISQNAKGYTVKSQALLKGLLDFASAGQPLDKGLKSAASLVRVLQDPKGNMTQVKQAVEALGPQAKKAFDAAKKSGIDTMSELRDAIASGQFSVLGEVQGQFDAVNDTLLSRGKRIFSVMRSQMADVGDTFLPDVKVALERLGKIFNETLFRIRGNLQVFGKGSFLDSLVGLAEKLSHILTNLFNKNLGQSEGMIDRIRERWKSFTYAMERTADYMRRFVDSAKILEKTFLNIFRPLKNSVAESFGNMNMMILNNKESFLDFGTAVGELLVSIRSFGQMMQKIFVDALPFINKILSGVKVFVDAITTGVELLQSALGPLGKSFGAFQTLMSIRNLGKSMGSYKGGLFRVEAMSVAAKNVTVVGSTPTSGMGIPGQTGFKLPPGVTIPGLTPGGAPGGVPGRMASAKGSVLSTAYQAKNIGTFLGLKPDPAAASGAGEVAKEVAGTLLGPDGQPLASGGSGRQGMASRMAGIGGKILQFGGKITGGLSKVGGLVNKIPGAQKLMMLHPAGRAFQAVTTAGTMLNQQYQKFANTKTGQFLINDAKKFGARVTEKGSSFLEKRKERLATGGPRGFGLLTSSFAERQKNTRMGRAMSRFNQGAGARMGVSMGMGVLGNMMPKEAQGAMALGSMVANFNPMLGAAVGLGGAALSARTGAGGLMMGAGAGAALGSFLGPAGTIVGAVVGGLTGAMLSVVNRHKMKLKSLRNAAKATVDGLMNTVFDGINESVRRFGAAGRTAARVRAARENLGGTGQSLSSLRKTSGGLMREGATGDQRYDFITMLYKNQEKFGVKISEKEYKDAKGNEDSLHFLSALNSQLTTADLAFDTVVKKYEKRSAFFSGMFGKTEEELLRLAEATGVNLYDASMSAKDMFQQLAQGMIHDIQSMQAAAAEFGSQTMSLFDTAIKKAAAGPAIRETTEVIRQMVLAGQKPATAELLTYLQNSLGQLVDLEGGDTMAGLEKFYRLFVEGRAFSTPGNQLTGMRDTFYGDPASRAALDEFGKRYSGFRRQAMAEFVTGGLGSAGLALGRQLTLPGMPGIGAKAPEFKTLTQQEILKMAGGFNEDQRKRLGSVFADMQSGDMSNAQILERLRGISDVFDGLTLAPIEDAASSMGASATKFVNSTSDFKLAVDKFSSLMNNDPSGTAQRVYVINQPGGDTRTPRAAFGDTSSAFGSTLSKHNSINSRIPGNRMITSGMRNFNLGSLNSDHLTGNAIDLVGSNLVSYQTAMRGAGGFAEFHGAGPNRHLHTVPNAMGDTSSSMAGGGGSYNYNITINGSGMNAQQVANEVARIIERTHRNKVERS